MLVTVSSGKFQWKGSQNLCTIEMSIQRPDRTTFDDICLHFLPPFYLRRSSISIARNFSLFGSARDLGEHRPAQGGDRWAIVGRLNFQKKIQFNCARSVGNNISFWEVSSIIVPVSKCRFWDHNCTVHFLSAMCSGFTGSRDCRWSNHDETLMELLKEYGLRRWGASDINIICGTLVLRTVPITTPDVRERTPDVRERTFQIWCWLS